MKSSEQTPDPREQAVIDWLDDWYGLTPVDDEAWDIVLAEIDIQLDQCEDFPDERPEREPFIAALQWWVVDHVHEPSNIPRWREHHWSHGTIGN